MKNAQLIKREEKTLYLENGIVLSLLNKDEKLAHTILGKETKTLTTEEVVTRFRAKNRKDLDVLYWNYMEAEKLDANFHFLVIDNN